MISAELFKQLSSHVPFIGLIVKNPPVGRDRLIESLLIIILTSTATVKFQEKSEASISPNVAAIRQTVDEMQYALKQHQTECENRVKDVEKEQKELQREQKEIGKTVKDFEKGKP